MLLLDLITEQTVTQPPDKLPASGGVPIAPVVGTAGDAAKTVIAQPKPSPGTAKPQPTGPAAAQQTTAPQAGAQPNAAGGQPTNATQTSMEQSQAELEERVMQRMQELAGMLRR